MSVHDNGIIKLPAIPAQNIGMEIDFLPLEERIQSSHDDLAEYLTQIEDKVDRILAIAEDPTNPDPPTDPEPPEPPDEPDPPVDPPAPTGSYTVLSALYGTYTPPIHPSIGPRLPMIFQSTPFPGGRLTLTEADIDRTADRYPDAGRVVVDVEHLYPFRTNVSPSTTELLVRLMAGLQERRPGTDWGIYGLPIRNYYTQNDSWRAQGDHVAPVLEHCDTIYPSIYTFRNLPITEAYIKGMVTEAVRLAKGKPVLPFHWPVKHGNGGPHGVPLTADEFDQVTTWALEAGASGIVIWGDKFGPHNDGGVGGWWDQMIELAEQE